VLDVGRLLIDGGLLAVVMLLFLLGMLCLNPRLFLNKGDCPPDVLAAVPPKTPQEKKLAALLGVPFILIMFGVPLASTMVVNVRAHAGASFWQLSAHALGVMAIPFFVDLLILDWLLVCTFTPRFVVIPGTEGFAGYKDYGFHLRAHARAAVPLVVAAAVIAVLARAIGYPPS
jgi:hypothetical protein